MKQTTRKATEVSTATIGIDLGDKTHESCTLGPDGTVLDRSTLLNERESLLAFSRANRGARIIMEAGTHSPWISRLFEGEGHKVVVANPRKLRAIYESDNKTDERDAEMLARIGRFDRRLLHGISHKSEEHQRSLKVLQNRDTLVACRTKLINSTRGSLKSLGVQLGSGWSAEVFTRRAREQLSDLDQGLVTPLLLMIDELSAQIKELDRVIDQMIEHVYPEAQKLSQIPGVGPVTSLAFVLIIGSPDRFRKPRQVGPFLGLVPRRDQSGDTDKNLRITKSGNSMLRRLLVSCAQYTLSQHGPPSDLKAAGERRAGQGNRIAKKKAVVMTARKLAVNMVGLWRSEHDYQPFHRQAA